MRFSASRIGKFNEYLYTFFKCLSPDRIDYVENWYSEQSDTGEDIAIDGWIVQRRCPHLHADLAQFGSTDGTVLTCGLHSWKFDLEQRTVPDLARPRDPRPASGAGRDSPPEADGSVKQGFPGGCGCAISGVPPRTLGWTPQPRVECTGGRRGRQELVPGFVPPRVRQTVGAGRPLQPGHLRQDRGGQVHADQRHLRRGGGPDRDRGARHPRQSPLPGQDRVPRAHRHPGPRGRQGRPADHQGAGPGHPGEPAAAADRADPRRLVLRPRHGPPLRGHRGRLHPAAVRARPAGAAGHDAGADAGGPDPSRGAAAGRADHGQAVADHRRPAVHDVREAGRVHRPAGVRVAGSPRCHLSRCARRRSRSPHRGAGD